MRFTLSRPTAESAIEVLTLQQPVGRGLGGPPSQDPTQPDSMIFDDHPRDGPTEVKRAWAWVNIRMLCWMYHGVSWCIHVYPRMVLMSGIYQLSPTRATAWASHSSESSGCSASSLPPSCFSNVIAHSAAKVKRQSP